MRHRLRALQRPEGGRRHRGVRHRAGRNACLTKDDGRGRKDARQPNGEHQRPPSPVLRPSSPTKAMVIALLSLDLHFAMARSLKDKRMVLHGIKDRIRKHNVAMAEVEHQELWQRAGLAIVTVATTEDRAEQELESVIAEIERV